jgi:CoA-transferase family III
MNRNKKSLTLDMKTPEGKEIFLRLAKDADVIVENLRPGVVDRLGIGYEDIKKINPQIIYCSISAFGQNGPSGCVVFGSSRRHLWLLWSPLRPSQRGSEPVRAKRSKRRC